MSSIVRSVKNVTKGYSAVEVKVRNATSNQPWGPTGSEMEEIAQLTFNNNVDFYQIMDMLDKRLNDKGKYWRHVLKSLKVLDYCLHEGSELVCTWAKKNIYIIKTLREFRYEDPADGREVGQPIRVAAKELTLLIQDDERLAEERRDRKKWKTRVTGIEEYGTASSGYGDSNGGGPSRPNRRDRRGGGEDDNDLEYKLALEASKNEAEEDKRRRERNAGVGGDDEDLQKALKLSKEEEELRRRQLEDANANSLFDDTPSQPAAAQPTGFNQGYQQQGAVDWFGNPVDQQQSQNTGFLNSAYSQQTGMQGQPTGYQDAFGNYGGYSQQAQQTGYDQFAQQNFLQQQNTSFNMNNPYSQQATGAGFGQGFGQQQQQPLEQQNTIQAGTNNPWASSNQQQSIAVQPTGSNNPFASSFNKPAQQQQQPKIPTLGSLQELQQEQKTQMQFNNQNFNPPVPFGQPQQAQPTQTKQEDPRHAHLNALLASGEGQDTFGNTGNLRIPAQHTAPGTFVNSAGSGINRLNATQTGNNPFLNSQFTGMPQQTGFAQNQVPAQTGPVGGFGGSNPFGRSQGSNQQQGGSLIDL